MYEQPYHPSQYPQGRPDSRDTGRRQDYQSSARASQVYGWKPAIFEQPSYGAFPGSANAYPGQDPTSVPVPVPFGRTTPGPSGLGKQQQPQGYSDPTVSSPYGPISAPPSTTTIPQQQQHIQAGYGTVGQGGYGHQPNVPYTQQGPMPYPTAQQPVQQQSQQQPLTSQQPTQTPAIQQQPIQTPVIQPQPVQAQVIQQQPVQVQPVQQPTQTQPTQQPTQAQPVLQPTQTQPVQQPTQAQPVLQPTHAQPVQQQLESAQQPSFSQHNSFEHEQPHQQLPIQAQPETVQAQSQPQAQVQASSGASSISPQRQAQPQPQAQAQPQQQQQQPVGPPYIYDPTTAYADPNVQAWAQYYAQGGRDLAGSVYFISIPGLTDQHAPGSTQQTEAQRGQEAQQGRQDQQHAANGTSGRRSLEGYNTSVKQQQPQPYQTQPQPSETELPHTAAAAATHQQQEQPSQLHESQFTQLSQYQPQHVQDQTLPQTLSQQQPSQSAHEYDYLGQNPYLQQQPSSVPDVGFKPSSPTRSTSFGLGPGGSRHSSGSIGGIQAGIAAATTGGTSTTPSWVLPKKTPPATVAGHPADMSGLPAQFRRTSLSGGASGPLRKTSLSGAGATDGLSHSPVNQGA